MSESKEIVCLSVLDALLKENFSEDEYSINGSKECAVCIEKQNYAWNVFESERNSRNDEVQFSNVVEACLDVIERMFLSKSEQAKSAFLDKIIVSQIA